MLLHEQHYKSSDLPKNKNKNQVIVRFFLSNN